MTLNGYNMVEILKALSDENRMRLFNLIKEKPLCVCELEYILKLSQSNVSRHLNKLKQAKIIRSEKEAQWIYYSIDSTFMVEHKSLYDYLLTQLKGVYQDDMEGLVNYQMSGLTCLNLRGE